MVSWALTTVPILSPAISCLVEATSEVADTVCETAEDTQRVIVGTGIGAVLLNKLLKR